MSSPHYNAGRLLLKDINSSNWYYLSVELDGTGEAFISPGQAAVSVPAAVTWREYAVLRYETDDTYYKVVLYSFEGSIYSNPELLATPEPANRIFLRNGSTLYEVIIDIDALGNKYLALRLASAAPTTEQCSPWKLINPISNSTPISISAVSVCEDAVVSISPVSPVCEREILV